MLQNPPKIILGIDPGTIVMGYGLLQVQAGRLSLLKMDVLKLNPKADQHLRLELIYRTVAELIGTFRPDTFAIEAPFYGKNVQSMLKLGRAQGVAIAAAIQAGLEVCEYSPKKVKQSITGNGNADKEQVWQMLQRILPIGEAPQYMDASDALAVAICHHFQAGHPQLPAATSKTGKGKKAAAKAGNWEAFVKLNADRVRGV
ncbi:crossover junction endodeoxyribonuclease RuvC [Flavihumibacter petaseus]|uniref:crossover junction endodeoxyribonuclease RuvC n=1 Tax=Flavihumibacter petaseus TaxID=549295 RepID=UPI001FDF0EB4|nr:crossover junction endodeoxyribonuclease RuvC [Flavihumibacter petaseus]